MCEAQQGSALCRLINETSNERDQLPFTMALLVVARQELAQVSEAQFASWDKILSTRHYSLGHSERVETLVRGVSFEGRQVREFAATVLCQVSHKLHNQQPQHQCTAVMTR